MVRCRCWYIPIGEIFFLADKPKSPDYSVKRQIPSFFMRDGERRERAMGKCHKICICEIHFFLNITVCELLTHCDELSRLAKCHSGKEKIKLKKSSLNI